MPEFTNPFVGMKPTGPLDIKELVRALRIDVAAEEDAISLYDAQSERAGAVPLVKKTLKGIADEEQAHIGELQTLIGKLDDETKQESKGRAEVEKESAVDRRIDEITKRAGAALMALAHPGPSPMVMQHGGLMRQNNSMGLFGDTGLENVQQGTTQTVAPIVTGNIPSVPQTPQNQPLQMTNKSPSIAAGKANIGNPKALTEAGKGQLAHMDTSTTKPPKPPKNAFDKSAMDSLRYIANNYRAEKAAGLGAIGVSGGGSAIAGKPTPKSTPPARPPTPSVIGPLKETGSTVNPMKSLKLQGALETKPNLAPIPAAPGLRAGTRLPTGQMILTSPTAQPQAQGAAQPQAYGAEQTQMAGTEQTQLQGQVQAAPVDYSVYTRAVNKLQENPSVSSPVSVFHWREQLRNLFEGRV